MATLRESSDLTGKRWSWPCQVLTGIEGWMGLEATENGTHCVTQLLLGPYRPSWGQSVLAGGSRATLTNFHLHGIQHKHPKSSARLAIHACACPCESSRPDAVLGGGPLAKRPLCFTKRLPIHTVWLVVRLPESRLRRVNPMLGAQGGNGVARIEKLPR